MPEFAARFLGNGRGRESWEPRQVAEESAAGVSASGDGPSTVHQQVRAGDQTRSRRCKEDYGTHHIIGFTDSTEWNVIERRFAIVGIG